MANLGGSETVVIDAPLEAVWGVVEDVLTAPQWQGGMNSMTALDRDGDGRPTLVEVETDAKVKAVKSHIRFDYDGGPARLSWKQVKGDLKSVEGAWTLEDLGDGRTRATYTLAVDPGMMLGMLVRGPVEGVLRAMLVNARPGELKKRVEQG